MDLQLPGAKAVNIITANGGRLGQAIPHVTITCFPKVPRSGLLIQLFVVNPKSTADMTQYDFTPLLPSLTPHIALGCGMLWLPGAPFTHVSDLESYTPSASRGRKTNRLTLLGVTRGGKKSMPHVSHSRGFSLSNLNLGTASLKSTSGIPRVRLGIKGQQTAPW